MPERSEQERQQSRRAFKSLAGVWSQPQRGPRFDSVDTLNLIKQPTFTGPTAVIRLEGMGEVEIKAQKSHDELDRLIWNQVHGSGYPGARMHRISCGGMKRPFRGQALAKKSRRLQKPNKSFNKIR
jgi:hypothetical protein